MQNSIKSLLIILCISFGACYSQHDNNSAKKNNGVSQEKERHDSFRGLLEGKLTKPYQATIGVAIKCIEDGDTFTLNNTHRYPMQSVYKFPIAMAILHWVDSGILSLNQKVHIRKSDLLKETWSPIRDNFPEGNIDLTIAELIQYTVGQSDNNGCDILLEILKGAKNANRYMQQIGRNDIAIVSTEDEMHKKPEIMYDNYSTPETMMNLLIDLYKDRHLSDSCNKLLMKTMTESNTGLNRIKGLLPEGTIVAHKTGTSGDNEKGISGATNDVGIITLPNGKHVVIVVFVSDSKEKHETNERIIAEISKATYQYFTDKNN